MNMRPHKKTIWSVITALSLIGALVIGVPWIIAHIMYKREHSFEITRWVFLGYAAFFLLLVGVFTPLVRRVWMYLKISRTSPLDSLMTLLIIAVASPVLVAVWIVLIPILRMKSMARYKYHIYNFAITTTYFLSGAMVRFRGTPPKKGTQYISIFNHTAELLDYELASIAQGTEPWNIVAGINLRHNKSTFVEWAITLTIGKIVEEHAISIDRSNEQSRQRTLRRILEEIKNGHNIAIFPEGTRTKFLDIVSSKILLKKFWDPIFKIAYENNIPVQPVVFDWPVIWKGKDDPRFGIRPCTIDVHFLNLVDPKEFESYESLKEHCWTLMHQKLESSKKVQRFLKEFSQEAK